MRAKLKWFYHAYANNLEIILHCDHFLLGFYRSRIMEDKKLSDKELNT